ncbi:MULTISPECIES: hypothetical protein [Streptomyces]|jgi:hypothetical protein|uniref:Uncharacterized protein n=2 Tax=Streptomyces TaxID=1883 RepID=A0ABW9I8C5_STRGJ|nr:MULTISPECIES: hypothetical protein [Streptomyces]MDX3528300.1 hypothetical protein [Streptomyces sp. ID05-39B]GGW30391.1 hypothetical protein GCM10010350_12170 [Streptomyces galilaeus]
MPATEPKAPRPSALAGVSMRDLLASCAAAEAVSRPPREPDPATAAVDKRHTRHREAA